MKKLVILLTLLWGMMAWAETTLVIEPLTGNELAQSIAQIGYVKFTDGMIRLYTHDGSLLAEQAISNVRKIVFQSSSPSDPTSLDNTDTQVCRIYPNPTAELLHIDAATAQSARIYDMSGHLLITSAVNDGQTTLDVSQLAPGNYLLVLGTEIMKIIKK